MSACRRRIPDAGRRRLRRSSRLRGRTRWTGSSLISRVGRCTGKLSSGLGETGRSIQVSTRRRSQSLRRRQERFLEISIRHPREPLGSAEIGWLSGSPFKCKVVNEIVGEARGAQKHAKAAAELGIYVAPDVNGLTEPLTGQRNKELAPLVDWIAPMLYHNILLQPPTWVESTLASVVKVAGKRTLPVFASRSEPRLRCWWRLGTADVWRRLERNAFASRRTIRHRRPDRLPGNGADGRKRSFAASGA